jgi:REP element-mobilizing transposase RayT
MDKFQGKFRISSIRLSNWDYGWNGIYFITICTNQRIPFLGKISEAKMELSPIGYHAFNDWMEIPNHFKFIELDSFIIMPNHVHGILQFDKDYDGRYELKPLTGTNRQFNQGKSTLSSVIGAYKSAVSKHVHLINLNFKWQERF